MFIHQVVISLRIYLLIAIEAHKERGLYQILLELIQRLLIG